MFRETIFVAFISAGLCSLLAIEKCRIGANDFKVVSVNEFSVNKLDVIVRFTSWNSETKTRISAQSMRLEPCAESNRLRCPELNNRPSEGAQTEVCINVKDSTGENTGTENICWFTPRTSTSLNQTVLIRLADGVNRWVYDFNLTVDVQTEAFQTHVTRERKITLKNDSWKRRDPNQQQIVPITVIRGWERMSHKYKQIVAYSVRSTEKQWYPVNEFNFCYHLFGESGNVPCHNGPRSLALEGDDDSMVAVAFKRNGEYDYVTGSIATGLEVQLPARPLNLKGNFNFSRFATVGSSNHTVSLFTGSDVFCAANNSIICYMARPHRVSSYPDRLVCQRLQLQNSKRVLPVELVSIAQEEPTLIKQSPDDLARAKQTVIIDIKNLTLGHWRVSQDDMQLQDVTFSPNFSQIFSEFCYMIKGREETVKCVYGMLSPVGFKATCTFKFIDFTVNVPCNSEKRPFNDEDVAYITVDLIEGRFV